MQFCSFPPVFGMFNICCLQFDSLKQLGNVSVRDSQNTPAHVHLASFWCVILCSVSASNKISCWWRRVVGAIHNFSRQKELTDLSKITCTPRRGV